MSITIRVKMDPAFLGKVHAAARTPLRNSGMELERAMKLTLSVAGGASHTPSAPGMPPNRQHGELRSSVHNAATDTGVIAGATARYAHMQETGGTIYAKGKLLAVPIDRSAYGKSPRMFPGLKFIPLRNLGALAGLLVQKWRVVNARGGRYQRIANLRKSKALFALMRQVTLKPRPFVQRSLDAALPNIMKHWQGKLRA